MLSSGMRPVALRACAAAPLAGADDWRGARSITVFTASGDRFMPIAPGTDREYPSPDPQGDR